MLDKILDWRNLCAAWENVADNRGGAGADRVSIARFAHHWHSNLVRLQDLVWAGKYRPGKLRRVGIPKQDGSMRVLQIPNVGDRVLQRAALNVVEWPFERHFYQCSVGYRKGRGVRNAVEMLIAFRERGLTTVLDADIDACFDSINHSLLRGFLMAEINDYRVMRLMELWLRAGSGGREAGRGIAMGMPVSPLWCNVFLHELDRTMMRGRWAYVRYADDFVVCCNDRAQAEQAQTLVAERLAGLKLQFEPSKTRITSFDEGFDYLGVHFKGDCVSFLWQERPVRVRASSPPWLWGYLPTGYE